VKLHGGFIPRTYAKNLLKEGEAETLRAVIEKGYIEEGVTALVGSELHYNMFESMISGRNMHGDIAPAENWRRIF